MYFRWLHFFEFLSLLSDSNQRPRDYKSRALANWAKEAGGKAICIAPLQPTTLAAVRPWGIRREHAVQDFPIFVGAKVDIIGGKHKF